VTQIIEKVVQHHSERFVLEGTLSHHLKVSLRVLEIRHVPAYSTQIVADNVLLKGLFVHQKCFKIEILNMFEQLVMRIVD